MPHPTHSDSMIPHIPDDYPGATGLRVIGWSLISGMIIANLLCLLCLVRSGRASPRRRHFLPVVAVAASGFVLLILTPIMILLVLDGFGSQGQLVAALWGWYILLIVVAMRKK